MDPYVATLTYLAVTLAYQGYIDQARSRMDEALSEARRLKHAHTLAPVLCYGELARLAHPLAYRAHGGNVRLYRPSMIFRFTWAGHWHFADGR